MGDIDWLICRMGCSLIVLCYVIELKNYVPSLIVRSKYEYGHGYTLVFLMIFKNVSKIVKQRLNTEFKNFWE